MSSKPSAASRSRSRLPSLLIAGCVMLAGCGAPLGDVAGRVTFKGAPVTNGSIHFFMKGKGIAQSADIDAGTYKMAVAMPTGSYQVYYLPPVPPPPGTIKAKENPTVKSLVSDKHRSPETSELSVEVKAGKNDLLIDFKD